MAGWTAIRLPIAANWGSISYGNRMFVAVESTGSASGKNIAYSTDGITWKAASAPKYADFKDIAYGNGRFVAIGIAIAYSSDGENWTVASDTLNGSGIAYGNGKFVAVGGSGKVLYSTNGTSWSTAAISESVILDHIAYGDGLFVATATDGSLYYSTNGTNWAKSTRPSTYAFSSIAYGNGIFVVVSEYGTGYYSTDGYTWNNCGIGAGAWSGITYGDGKFVAVSQATNATSSNGSNIVAYSEDGFTWIKSTLPSTLRWSDVAYGNGKFVAISGGISTASIAGAYISTDMVGIAALSLSETPAGGGSVAGAGTYAKGTSVTVTSVPADGWEFVCWQENGAAVSTSASYTFTITASRSLTAVFKQKLTAWIGVGGKARKGVELYVGVNGKARKVTGAWIGVNGKARRFL